jgi:hypothetical protein
MPRASAISIYTSLRDLFLALKERHIIARREASGHAKPRGEALKGRGRARDVALSGLETVCDRLTRRFTSGYYTAPLRG